MREGNNLESAHESPEDKSRGWLAKAKAALKSCGFAALQGGIGGLIGAEVGLQIPGLELTPEETGALLATSGELDADATQSSRGTKRETGGKSTKETGGGGTGVSPQREAPASQPQRYVSRTEAYKKAKGLK